MLAMFLRASLWSLWSPGEETMASPSTGYTPWHSPYALILPVHIHMHTQIPAPTIFPQISAWRTHSPTHGMSSGTFSASLEQSVPRGKPTTRLCGTNLGVPPALSQHDAQTSTMTMEPSGPTHVTDWASGASAPLSLEMHHETAAPLCVIPSQQCHDLGHVLSLLEDTMHAQVLPLLSPAPTHL